MTEAAGGNVSGAEIEAVPLTSAQRALLSDLSDDELDTLSRIGAGLKAARAARPKPKPTGSDSTGVFYY